MFRLWVSTVSGSLVTNTSMSSEPLKLSERPVKSTVLFVVTSSTAKDQVFSSSLEPNSKEIPSGKFDITTAGVPYHSLPTPCIV